MANPVDVPAENQSLKDFLSRIAEIPAKSLRNTDTVSARRVKEMLDKLDYRKEVR